MNILLLSRYENLGASSRYRTYQYVPALRTGGHTVDVRALLSNNYIAQLYAGRRRPVTEVAASYLRRIVHLLESRSYDLVWTEYEALPWVPYVVESFLRPAGIPFVLDMDDAVFHRYDLHRRGLVRRLLGNKIGRVMRAAALVIAGNEYIAAYARKAGARRVEILPTVVDLEMISPAQPHSNEKFMIGWIGTPMTDRYLKEAIDPLRAVCSDGSAQLVTVGAGHLTMEGVPHIARGWDLNTEISEIQEFDVGIMPLVDSPWERGKCGHKLIKYMACSKPVVASAVGVNREIVEHGVNGFLASGTEEWIKALMTLKQDPELCRRMGDAGRKKVEERYSLKVTAPVLAGLFSRIAEDRR